MGKIKIVVSDQQPFMIDGKLIRGVLQSKAGFILQLLA